MKKAILPLLLSVSVLAGCGNNPTNWTEVQLSAIQTALEANVDLPFYYFKNILITETPAVTIAADFYNKKTGSDFVNFLVTEKNFFYSLENNVISLKRNLSQSEYRSPFVQEDYTGSLTIALDNSFNSKNNIVYTVDVSYQESHLDIDYAAIEEYLGLSMEEFIEPVGYTGHTVTLAGDSMTYKYVVIDFISHGQTDSITDSYISDLRDELYIRYVTNETVYFTSPSIVFTMWIDLVSDDDFAIMISQVSTMGQYEFAFNHVFGQVDFYEDLFYNGTVGNVQFDTSTSATYQNIVSYTLQGVFASEANFYRSAFVAKYGEDSVSHIISPASSFEITIDITTVIDVGISITNIEIFVGKIAEPLTKPSPPSNITGEMIASAENDLGFSFENFIWPSNASSGLIEIKGANALGDLVASITFLFSDHILTPDADYIALLESFEFNTPYFSSKYHYVNPEVDFIFEFVSTGEHSFVIDLNKTYQVSDFASKAINLFKTIDLTTEDFFDGYHSIANCYAYTKFVRINAYDIIIEEVTSFIERLASTYGDDFVIDSTTAFFLLDSVGQINISVTDQIKETSGDRRFFLTVEYELY